MKHHFLQSALIASALVLLTGAHAQTDNRPVVRVAVQQVANS